MGVIDTFFIQSFSTTRAGSSVLSNTPCLLTKDKDEATNMMPGTFGKAFKLYTRDGQDVREGDVVTIDGTDYTVKATDDLIPDMFEGTDSLASYIVIRSNRAI